MPWFVPQCPVEAEDKTWIEESMLWLIDEFGAETLRETEVILPTDEFFPDPFSRDEDDLRALVDQVCDYMDVDPERLEVDIFTDDGGAVSRGLPSYS